MATFIYDITRRLASSGLEQATREHTDFFIQEVLEVSGRDPIARVLVVVNVQYCHIIRKKLRAYDDVEVVTYTDL